mgnify:CR=1 FL=1
MTDDPAALNQTLHGLLGAIAAMDPDRVALLDLDSRLTFGELWTRAGRLSAALVESGVRPGDVVVVALPRSVDTVVGCFAILRSGAVLLPIDLRLPVARNRKLVDEARARWALVRGTVRPECVDHIQAIEVGARPSGSAPPAKEVEGRDQACLIFTSGSSGEAKGVRISHHALGLRSRVEKEANGLTAADVYLLRTSPAFVGMVVGLTILASGTTTAVASEDVGDQAEPLLDLIGALKATFVPLSPRLLEAMLDLPDLASRAASLRVVRSAGEALRPELAERFHTALPWCQLVDGYGTTETSGVIASRVVKGPGAPADSDRATPLESVRIRLAAVARDPRSEGEILVSTPMLATGYLGGEPDHDPRFVDEPALEGGPPIRWYRTGDRGCLSPQGGLKVLGRLDLQLNVDGVRAEPCEIENVLRLHDSVADAAVRTWPDASGRNRLVAYVVDRSAPATAAALRTFASHSLPRTLIPMRFVRVDALPLTVSGKVDRESLPSPGLSLPSARAPEDPPEAALLPLFREVLGAPALGVEDDFFDCGGDSLMAVALMMRIDEVMGKRLSAAVLLNAPTVATLAREVARDNTREVEATWLRREGDLPPLVCLPGLAGDPMWFMPLIEALDRGQPILGLSFVGLKPPMVISTAADLGVETLMSVQPRGPYFLLGHSLGGVLAFEMARRLKDRSETVAFLGLIDTFVPGRQRVHPTSRSHRFRRWRNRMFGLLRQRFGPLLRGVGLPVPRRRSMFVQGLKVAAQNHRIAPCDLGVTLFRANERSAFNNLPADWRPLARGGVEVVDIPGHHFDLISGGRARELSARIAGAVRLKTI